VIGALNSTDRHCANGRRPVGEGRYQQKGKVSCIVSYGLAAAGVREDYL
jgi:hypothetical protein